MTPTDPLPAPAFARVAVFCGSRHGQRPAYTDAARRLGSLLARNGTELVYGGGRVGLMGEVADAVLAGGGRVIGVIPHGLERREVAHAGLVGDRGRLEIVPTMHERKQRMYELSDAMIAMPGGIGTLEELFEAFTWHQLGIHHKPCALLDVDGYWQPLVRLLDHLVTEGFVDADQRELLIDDSDPVRLLERIEALDVPARQGWETPDP